MVKVSATVPEIEEEAAEMFSTSMESKYPAFQRSAPEPRSRLPSKGIRFEAMREFTTSTSEPSVASPITTSSSNAADAFTSKSPEISTSLFSEM